MTMKERWKSIFQPELFCIPIFGAMLIVFLFAGSFVTDCEIAQPAGNAAWFGGAGLILGILTWPITSAARDWFKRRHEAKMIAFDMLVLEHERLIREQARQMLLAERPRGKP